MSNAHLTLHGQLAVIRMENPPVNGLSHELRQGIVAALQQAEANPEVKAVVLTGGDKTFSGGADIKEFGSPKAYAQPNLPTVISYLESSRLPVVAAIGGVCMGGGLELALGCHHRVVAPGAQIAFPEVKLGLLPGAGGTQRMPRVVGLEMAVNLIVSGATMPAEAFKATRLFDHYAEGDLVEAALAYAAKIVAEGRPLVRVRDLEVKHPAPEAFFLFAKTAVGAAAKHFPAPMKCLEAVEASVTKRFDDGLKAERDGFSFLINTDESRALRHAFLAERAATKIPDVPESTPTRPVRSVGIIGAGTMGSGIALAFLDANIPVVLLEMSAEALERGLGSIRKVHAGQVAKGKLTAEVAQKRQALLRSTLSFDDLRDVDLVIEAVFEEMSVKQTVFKKLDEICKPGAILASNTSTLDLDAIAATTRRPEDVIGLHFFSPANVMRLLEVVRGAKTGKDVLATAMKLAKTIKKTAVVAGVCDGFIGNRMIAVYQREALVMIEEGASPEQIDRAVEGFGFAMGPLKMADLAGGDIGWAIRKRRYAEHPETRRMLIADRLCELGRFGQKTSAGYYRYEPGKRDALPDPAVAKLIAECRAERGITPRAIDATEIVQRCVYALVNEGARILEAGIAQRASDIDLCYLAGYGFPIHRGGPMLYADTVGLPNVVRAMQRFAANPMTDHAFWQPAPLLAKLAAEGRTFTEEKR